MNEEDRLTNIRQNALRIEEKFDNYKDTGFESKYAIGKLLGEGMHAQVFKCFKLADT